MQPAENASGDSPTNRWSSGAASIPSMPAGVEINGRS
jgi:hypothetical protein